MKYYQVQVGAASRMQMAIYNKAPVIVFPLQCTETPEEWALEAYDEAHLPC
jgi:hypothetical protein